MSSIPTGTAIGLKFCSIIPNNVRKITIELEAGSIAIVTVERVLSIVEADGLVTELDLFKLVALDNQNPPERPSSGQ